MSREYILAIDQGTTSSRAIIFNRRGQSVSIAQREFRQHYPADGWVEHDPLDIWSSQNAVTAEALAKANLGADNVAAAGITNQRETTLVWDRRTGEPIYNAIVWQDRRTAAECRRMREEGLEDLFSSKTGLRLDPYFSGTKLGWILNNVEGARARAEKGELAFGTVDTWLIWNFTNGKIHATDATNASRTLLYNIHTCEWDDALLEILNIPRQMLPQVRSCSEIYGEIATRHFPAGVPIAGVAGDQHAALFGQACFEKGMAKNTYGTGCFLLMNTGDEVVRSKNNLLTTLAWKIGNSTIYALEGSVFIAGALIQWLRDELGIITTASDCDRLAQRVDNNGGVYIVPAFSGLGAPYWDPCARGTILGLTRGTTRNHICRAAIEAVAFQSADLVRAMEADSGIRLKELRIDGGASISDPLIQFQADILGTTVVRPSCNETTALGAAYLAGLATGYWESVEEVATIWAEDKRVAPKMPDADARRLRLNWQRAVERSRDWIEPEPQE